MVARSGVAAEAPRPNIVLIVIDDLGWADLGCSGSTFYETPNIDRLARRGVRFTDAYAACPVCSPSRAALMTGKSPARLHLTDWLPGRGDRPSQKLLRPSIRRELPLAEVTLAEALKPAGYATASVGKWHLGGPGFWPEQQGFDLNVGGTQTGSPPGGYFRFRTPNLAARSDEDYLTDRLTDEAVDFIGRHKGSPFFLYLAHYAVHIPLQAKSETLSKFEGKPAGDSLQDNPIYAAMIRSVDDGVGKVLRALEVLKIADQTVVIFTSDNGGLSVKEGPNTPATSNAPLRAGKGYLLRGGNPGPVDRRRARGDPARLRLRRAGKRAGPLPDDPRHGRRESRPRTGDRRGESGPVVEGRGGAAAGRPLLALPPLQQPGG